jgi:Clp amino terminal domain, pathogenicity island component
MTDVRFNESARQVLVRAAEEARERNHCWIGPEHLLLGLADDPGGMAAHLLASLGVLDGVRERAGETIFRPVEPFDPGVHRLLMQLADYYREGLRRAAAGEEGMAQWAAGQPNAEVTLAFLDAVFAFAGKICGGVERELFFALIMAAMQSGSDDCCVSRSCEGLGLAVPALMVGGSGHRVPHSRELPQLHIRARQDAARRRPGGRTRTRPPVHARACCPTPTAR